MLDLQAMRKERAPSEPKQQVKTYLSAAARERLELAAEFVGCPQHEIVEALIWAGLPALRRKRTQE